MTTDPLREGLETLVAEANERPGYAIPGYIVRERQLWVERIEALLAETAPWWRGCWDEVGGSMWFDRHQWGVIIDGLILQRAEAEARKATNEYSNSDERAAMCVDLIERINAADGLATPPPAPVAGVEVTDAMVDRGWRAHQATWPASPEDAMRAALTAALTPEAGE